MKFASIIGTFDTLEELISNIPETVDFIAFEIQNGSKVKYKELWRKRTGGFRVEKGSAF